VEIGGLHTCSLGRLAHRAGHRGRDIDRAARGGSRMSRGALGLMGRVKHDSLDLRPTEVDSTAQGA
jgi:hypothetical protein